MLMRTDRFLEFDRLTQQFFGAGAQGTWSRPNWMPLDAYRSYDQYVIAFGACPGYGETRAEVLRQN